MEMKLTRNFTLNEMCKSVTAKRRGIKNVPSFGDIKRLKALCENVLQPLRDYLGEPVIINSGYRSPELNLKIGGVHGSQHLKGEAADVRCTSKEYAQKVIEYIMLYLNFDQLILETKKSAIWVHVSYTTTGKNRQQVLSINK